MMEEHHRRPLSVGHSIAGYSIVREIGRGGFGIVYEAVNPVTRDRAAIKQFYPQAIASWLEGTIVVKRSDAKDLVEKVLRRFEDEATLQFNFSHPNILKVKNFIRADNTGYQISEYIDGTSLAGFLDEQGNVFPDEDIFRRTMEPVADALGYVHESGVLHRDISPDNILIETSGRPILVDFGAAKLDLLRNPSVSSIVPYKEAYAPIEQQVPSPERPEGFYTDIYALAGTMYRAIAGRPPAKAIDRGLASKDPYVPLAEAAKTRCSDAVYAAIDRGLALPPASRPQSIADFMEMLGWRESATPSVAPIEVVTPPDEPALQVEPTAEPEPAPQWEPIGKPESAPHPEPVVVKSVITSDHDAKRSSGGPLVALLVAGACVGLLWLSVPPSQLPTSTPSPVATSAPVLPSSPPSSPAPLPPSNPQEEILYDAALTCMRNATSCSIDYCLVQYRVKVGFGNRYPELRNEYFRLVDRCTPPKPSPSPHPRRQKS